MNKIFGYLTVNLNTNNTPVLDFSELKLGIKKIRVWYRYAGTAPTIGNGVPTGYEKMIQLYPFSSPSISYEFPIIDGKSPNKFYLNFDKKSSAYTITIYYIIEEFGGEGDANYVNLNFNGTYKE